MESALLRRIITGVVLAALFLLPVFEPHQFVLHMLSLVAISATVALGLQLLLGFSGQLSIGQAAFYSMKPAMTRRATMQKRRWPGSER